MISASDFFASKCQTMHSFYIFVSSREPPGTMGNISLLLTEFFVVGFFIAKVRSRLYVTQITRTNDDIFTNAFCGNCSEYGAKYLSERICQCKYVPLSISQPSSSVFLRSERKCKSGKELRGK